VQPYAPPAAPYVPPAPPAPGGGPPLDWEVTELLSGAWNVFTRHWAPLCVGMLIAGLIISVPLIVVYVAIMVMAITASEAANSGNPDAAGTMALIMGGVALLAVLLVFLLSPIFTARLLRMSLTAVRGGTPQVGDLFKGEMRYGSMLALTLLQTFCIFLGYLLLIVPGVILALGLYFSVYFVVDRRMGATDAMKASWQATTGRKGQVFVLMLVLGLVAAGCGFIPFVGHFIGYSLMMLGISIAYGRLMGERVPVLPAPPPPAYPPQWQQQQGWPQQQQQPWPQQQSGYGPPPPPGGYGPPR
jgi:uncharacterized membrane protein